MTKARIAAIAALSLIIVDVLINFSVAIMNTAMDVTTLVLVAIAMIMMRKENKD